MRAKHAAWSPLLVDGIGSEAAMVMLTLKDLRSVLRATLTGNVSGDNNKKHHYRKASRSGFMTQGSAFALTLPHDYLAESFSSSE